MTDSIRTECPKCHTQYKIGLNQISTGKSKAKCGRCKTSFVIKDNLASQSLLQMVEENNQAIKEGKVRQDSIKNNNIETFIQTKITTKPKVAAQSIETTNSLFDTPITQSVPLKKALPIDSSPIPTVTKTKPKSAVTNPILNKSPRRSQENLTKTNSDSSILIEAEFGSEWSCNEVLKSKPKVLQPIESDLLFSSPDNTTATSNPVSAPTKPIVKSGSSVSNNTAFDTEGLFKSISKDTTAEAAFGDVCISGEVLKQEPIAAIPNVVAAKAGSIKNIPKNPKPVPEPFINPTHSERKDTDFLFHDDMDFDNDIKDRTNNTDALTEVSINDDWAFNEDLIGTIEAPNTATKFANTIEQESSWLEDLLEDKDEVSHSDTQPIVPSKEDTDLTDLLNDLEVESSKPTASSLQAATAMANKRLESRAKHSAKQGSLTTSILWLIGCLALVFLLIAQYAIFNLETLIKNPSHRATLQSFCDIVTCALPDANVLALTISKQKLQTNKTNGAATDIIATITNNSSTEQLYPNLRVEIYGIDNIIGNFIATPSDYLTTSHSLIGQSQITQFMLTVELPIDTISQVKITPFY